MNTQLKQFLSLMMAAIMVVSVSLGSIAYAQEDASAPTEPVQTECTKAVDCPADTHADDCEKKLADDETAKKQEEPVTTECTKEEDCPADTHADDCKKKLAETPMIVDTPVLNSIEVVADTLKTSYGVGDALDVSGSKLTLIYSDNTTSEVEITADMVTGYNSTTTGEQTLTVTYGTHTTSFIVKVKQVQTLYERDFASSQIIAGQGMSCNYFSTSANGSAVSADKLKTDGVAEFIEGDHGKMVTFTAAGSGSVFYETDDTIYRHEITAYDPLYMRLPDKDPTFFYNMSLGQELQDVSFSTDWSGENIVQIEELACDSLLSIKEENESATLVASGAGRGYITYTDNGNIYKADILVNGGNSNPGGGNMTGPHSCDNKEPHLLMRSNDGTDYCTEVTLNSGEAMSGLLLFYNGNVAGHFDPSKISVTGTAVLQRSGDSYTLGANDYGEGYINFPIGDNTHSLRVISLAPAYGLFSAAEQSMANHLAGFSGAAGEECTAYLIWTPDSTTPSSIKLSLNEDGSSPVEVTPVETTAGYIAFKFSLPQATSMWLHVSYADNTLLSSSKYWVEASSSERPLTVEVQHKGQTVTVGIGMTMPEQMVLNDKEAFRATPREGFDMSQYVGLVALNNYGNQATQTAADESFFKSITDVTFQMVEWTNFDEEDSSQPIVGPVQKVTSAGRETSNVLITKESMKLGMGWLRLTFKYDGVEYKTYRQIVYSGADIDVAISPDMTVADLNAVLSNGAEVFWAWLVENYPQQAEAYDGGFVNLHMPAKNYDDVILVDLAPRSGPMRFNAIRFAGKTGTVIRGIEAKTRVFAIENITFNSGSSEPNGTALLHNTPANYPGEMIGVIYNCSFENYEYAVAEKGYGFIRDIMYCQFDNCGTAVLMDGKTSGAEIPSSYVMIKNSQFNYNQTAVCIKNLPDGITAFNTRIVDNYFMFNAVDFDLSNLNLGNKNGDKAHFYFTKNYFGKNANGNGNDNAMRGPAEISVNNSKVKVITNPVRKTRDFGNEYWVYTGENQYSAIFGSEANNILVDGESFNSPTTRSATPDSAEIPISIVDENGNEIASWTF